MTNQTDYDAVLELLPRALHGYSTARDIIKRALLIAKKLEGEPSDIMIEVVDNYETDTNSLIEAMRDQLIKEVEEQMK